MIVTTRQLSSDIYDDLIITAHIMGDIWKQDIEMIFLPRYLMCLPRINEIKIIL